MQQKLLNSLQFDGMDMKRDQPESQHDILVAEDDEMVRKLIDEILGESYRLHFAANGASALEQARTYKPELVILDIMMPDINGFEVCRQLRQEEAFKRTIILILTALSDKDSQKSGINAGADDYLTKPFNVNQLRSLIQKWGTHIMKDKF